MRIFFVFFLISQSLWAEDELLSARRDLKVDYELYERRAFDNEQIRPTSVGGSALRSARLFGLVDLPKATKWRSMADLQKRFEYIRDTRFMVSTSHGPDLRRPTWLYPDDGCYARAAVVNRSLFRLFVPVPSKVFAFGNLRVKTTNSPRGRVGWWYHVAPIVEVDGSNYVLDPAIEPMRPLPLTEWLERMGTPAEMKVSICSSGTIFPGSSCQKETDGIEAGAIRLERRFFDLEVKRLHALGRVVDNELGDLPPWRK